MFKKIAHRFLPVFVKTYIKKHLQLIRLLRCYIYDLRRYWTYSSTAAITDSIQLEAEIARVYHAIEKGLSLPETKVGFGKDKAESLVSLLVEYREKRYSLDSSQYLTALIVLQKYISFHDGENCRLIKIKEFVEKTVLDRAHISGGILKKKKSEILAASKQNFAELAFNRHSIRNFTDETVDNAILIDAIKIAQRSPSVCNRQATRIYLVENKETIRKVLPLQGGNIGFGHLINKLLIITADLRAFDGTHERNQGFIDGGMFAMSLLYSLQYHGLGACALNWARALETDLALRNVININDSNIILMMIGVGHLPDTIKLTYSQRKPYTDIFYIR